MTNLELQTSSRIVTGPKIPLFFLFRNYFLLSVVSPSLHVIFFKKFLFLLTLVYSILTCPCMCVWMCVPRRVHVHVCLLTHCCLYWIFSMIRLLGLVSISSVPDGAFKICMLIWAGFMTICCVCETKTDINLKTMWYQWKLQLKAEDGWLSHTRNDEEANRQKGSSELDSVIMHLFLFSWGVTQWMHEQLWANGILTWLRM